MAENVRPPVAIRIVRPYETEDELLEHELETVGKTSVILIGAHPRPTGVILRFEVTLASGATVLRGEGRVLAHKENAFRGQPGLTLRFTRLDPRSKAVVDRATAMREARAQDGSSPSRPAPRAEGALAEALTASTPVPSATSATSAPSAPSGDVDVIAAAPPPSQEDATASARANAREKANATARTNAKRTARMALTPPPVPVAEASVESVESVDESRPTPAPTPVTSVPGDVEEAPTHVETRTAAPPATAPTISAPPLRPSRSSGRRPSRAADPRDPPDAPASSDGVEAAPAAPAVPAIRAALTGPAPIEAPPDRADLLARLRERAGKLPPERVAEILAARR